MYGKSQKQLAKTAYLPLCKPESLSEPPRQSSDPWRNRLTNRGGEGEFPHQWNEFQTLRELQRLLTPNTDVR